MSFSADHLIPLKIASKNSSSQLLSSLNQWQEKGLISDKTIYLNLTAKDILAQKTTNFVEMSTKMSLEHFLAGLNQWQEGGLLDNAQIRVKIEVRAANPFLLEGLEEWLQLEFLSESQIKQLCQQNLSCILPPISSSVKVASTPSQPVVEPKTPVIIPQKTTSPSRFKQMLQSLMAELSVLWLLLLGVFMIVISSGVIAANLWEQFPAAGQYGVLWLYTLLFWAASFWAANRPNLRLTSMALRLVTLLLIPMNFLAMDSLGLWDNPLNWLIVILAALSLSLVTVKLFSGKYKISVPDQFPQSLPILLGLSYLHWGWGLAWFPIWATYLGVVGTALVTVVRPFKRDGVSEAQTKKTDSLVPFSLNGAIATYALAILLIRAIFIAQVEITQLGLAVGISGWLLTQPKKVSVSWWESIGASLLFLGWLLSVVQVPWQALAVSVLGIIFVGKRLLRSWLKLDFSLLLFIGLQGLWLLWRLIPEALGQGLIVWATRLTGSENTPGALLSLALFPYLILILVLSEWLSQRKKKKLATLGNQIALFFGITLTALSLVNPALRTINFAASTLTLGTLTQRQFQKVRYALEESEPFPSIPLAHCTHIAGLVTLVLGIDWIAPQLSMGIWGIILLFFMVIELSFSLIKPVSPTSLVELFSQSAWQLGLFLGGLSYGLLLLNQQAVLENLNPLFARPVIGIEWGLIWCLAPLTFTALGSWYPIRKTISSWLSVATLLLWQLLTLSELVRYSLGSEIVPNVLVAAISLGTATGLMLINTHNLQQLKSAAITVGFGLSWLALSLWGGIFGWGLEQEGSWLIAGAIASSSLWIFRHSLTRISSSRAVIYAEAFDGWATFLCCLTLFKLVDNTFTYFLVSLELQSAIAAGLLIVATAYRSSQSPRSSSAVWFGIATLLLVQLPLFTLMGYRLVSLAVATGLMVVYVNYLPQRSTAIINVGVALTLVVTALWDGGRLSSVDGWLLAMACILAVLWLLRSGFKLRSGKITTIYSQALDNWAIVLCAWNLFVLTLHSLTIYWDLNSASSLSILASLVTLSAIAYRTWQTTNNWGIYGIGWSLEIVTLEVLDFSGYSLIALAIANTILGLMTQLVGDWWYRRSGKTQMLSSWHIIPLFYGALGSALRWGVFSSWTGLSSLGLVLIAIGVGRRSHAFKSLLYLSIVGISLSAYELLLYQVSNLSIGDQLLAMVALTTSFVYGYRILTPWLTRYLRLTRAELKWVAFYHWALGSCLLFGALFYPVEVNQLVGLGAGIFLTRYAIFQGRNRSKQTIAEQWVYVGIFQGCAIALYINSIVSRNTLLFKYLTPWSGVLICLGAVALYLLPWKAWGWPNRPWRVVALALPLVGILGYLDHVNEISLIAVAGFYGWQGKIKNQSRWYEITLLFIDLVIIRWLEIFNLAIPLAYTSLIGLSLICLSWIEPRCQGLESKSLRHYLRLLGMGIICGTALLFHYQTGIIPAIISLIAIFVGLGFRVRAFLYIGTLTFLIDAFYHLVILVYDYPLFKWIVGLILGLSLLSIAGSFETRRTQLTAWLQNWLAQLQTWE